MCAESQNDLCAAILLPPTSGLTAFPCWKESKHIKVKVVVQTGLFLLVFAPSNDDFGPEDFKTSCVEMVVIRSTGSCEFASTDLDLVKTSDKADLRRQRRLKTNGAAAHVARIDVAGIRGNRPIVGHTIGMSCVAIALFQRSE